MRPNSRRLNFSSSSDSRSISSVLLCFSLRRESRSSRVASNSAKSNSSTGDAPPIDATALRNWSMFGRWEAACGMSNILPNIADINLINQIANPMNMQLFTDSLDSDLSWSMGALWTPPVDAFE